MEDAPVPPVVYIIPVGVGLTIAWSVVAYKLTKRQIEIAEWKVNGDLEVDGDD